MPSIRLPNGKVVRNVPEGITKEQFQNNAIKAGWATPEDFGLSPAATGGNVDPLTTQATPAALTNGATIPPLSSPGEQQPFFPPSEPVASMSQPRPIQGVDEAPEQFQARVNEWQQPTQPMGQQQPVAPQQPQLPTQQPKPTMQQRVQQFIADAQEVKTGMAESVNQPGFFTESVPDFWSKFSEGLSGKRLAAGFTADLLNTVGNKLRSNVEQNKKRYADQLRAGMITQQEYDRVIELLDQESAQNESMMKSFDLAPEDTAKVREFINKEEEEATPKGLSLVQRGMRSGAVSSMMNAPSTFAAVLGQTPLATAMFALPTYTSSYADAIEEGLDPDTANEYASLQTMVEVGTEANPIQKLKKIGGVFKGKKKEIETLKDKAFDDTLGKDVKDFMLSELGGEQVAFFGQTAIDIKYGMGIGKKWAGMTPEQRFKYLAEGAGESLVATLFAGGGQATLAAGVRRVFGDVDTGKAEKDIAKAIEDMPLQDTPARDYTQPKVIEQEAVQATQDADITEAMGKGEKVAPESPQPQMGSDTQSPFAQKMQTLDTKAYDDEKSGDEMAAEVATPQDSTMPTTEKPTEKPSVDVAPVTSKEAEKPQAPAEKSTVIPKAKPEVSKKPADVLNQQLPEILTAKKSAIVNKMMKDQGIKKGSPGFAEAKARIESEYEAELDKTLAQQPFEVFNAYNADVPESINRQAYDALRADFGIDNDVKFAKKSGYKGTDPVEAKEWVEAKKKNLPMDEKSRMARAKEMGGKRGFYHSTNAAFDSFDTNPANQLGAHFGTKDQAESRGGKNVGEYVLFNNNPLEIESDLGDWSDIEMLKEYLGEANYEVFTSDEMKNFNTPSDFVEAIKSKGYDSIVYENSFEGDGKSVIIFNPSDIRSINAAFDPAAKDSSDLLANREQAEAIPSKKPEKPVERKVAEQAVKDFLKDYKGVKDIPVDVFDNAVDAYGQKIVDREQLKPGDVSGSFWRNAIQIVRDGNETAEDVTRTLRHEAWVHYGLSLMNPEQKAAFLKRIKGLIAESRELTKIAEGVRKDYTRRDGSFSLREDVFYEEVAAKIAEKYGDEINDIVTGKIKKPTAFQTQLKKFYDVIVSALRQLGLLDKSVPREAQVQEAIDLVLDRAAYLRGVDSKNMRHGKTKGSPLFMVKDGDAKAEEAAPAFARKELKPFSVDSDFSSDPFTVKDADLVEKAVSYFVDRFERVRRVQKQIKEQGGEVATDADTYLAEELYHGKVGNDLDIFDKEIVEKLRDKMRKMGVSRELLDLYLIVRHAPERNRYVKSIRPDMESGSGVSTKEANATRAMLEESEYGSKLKELAADVDKIIRMRNELKVNAGLETKADQSKYPDWKHYVPMKGMAYDEKKGRMSGGGGGLNVQGKEDKVLKGRFSPPDSPLAYVIADMTETIIRARKAEVGNTFLNLVRDNPNPNLWEIFTEAKPDTTTVRVTENGKPVVKKKRMTAAEMKGATRNGMPVYFVTKRNGKEYFIKVKDDRLMDAMRNLGTEDMGVFLQAMATGTRYLSTMLTSFSPEFVVSNFIRDLQTAIYNITGEQTGKEGKLLGQKIAMQTIKDIGRAVSGIVSEEFSTKASEQKEWSKFYREFKEAGAKTGWFDQKSPEQLKKAIDKKLNRGKVADAFSGLLDSVDAVNTSVENAVRLATYVNARKAFEPLVQTGQMTDRESKDRAASLAKNLTVNFNRKGQAGSNLNALYMFANAAIQGNYQFYRTLFMRHPAGGANLTMSQKLAAGSVLVGFFLTLINEAISPDDDDGVSYYSKIPDYVKERNFIIMDHTDDDKKSPQREDYETDAEFKEAYDEFIEGRYTKLPMPYGYNIFTDVGVAVAEMYLGQKTNKEASSFLTTAVLGSFLPIGFPERDSTIESIRSGLVPTLAKPAAELMENRNFFNSPIMQEPFPNDTTPRSQLSKRTTGELWKWTAETLNTVSGGDETVSGAMDYSPDAFEHIWEFVSGGLGKTVNRTMKSVETAAKGEPVATNDIPFLRTVRAEPSKWRHSQYYFENKKLPLQRLDGYERLVEEGMDKEAEIYNETYGEYIILGQISDTIEKNLKKMRKALRRAEADDDKARIADIKQEMDRQYMRFNTAHRKLIRDGMIVEDYMKEVDK